MGGKLLLYYTIQKSPPPFLPTLLPTVPFQLLQYLVSEPPLPPHSYPPTQNPSRPSSLGQPLLHNFLSDPSPPNPPYGPYTPGNGQTQEVLVRMQAIYVKDSNVYIGACILPCLQPCFRDVVSRSLAHAYRQLVDQKARPSHVQMHGGTGYHRLSW